MRFNKKAALELSITAIVVLIIAITVLGLGIAFIKNFFVKGEVAIGDQFSMITERLKDEFLSQGVAAGFSTGADIEAKFGKAKEFYIGIRNTESIKRCFKAEVICEGPFTPGKTDCGKSAPGMSIITGDSKWFSLFPPDVEIDGNSIYVAPVTLHITDTPKDAYRIALKLYKSDECPLENPTEEQLIETRLMHIKVV